MAIFGLEIKSIFNLELTFFLRFFLFHVNSQQHNKKFKIQISVPLQLNEQSICIEETKISLTERKKTTTKMEINIKSNHLRYEYATTWKVTNIIRSKIDVHYIDFILLIKKSTIHWLNIWEKGFFNNIKIFVFTNTG